MSTQHTHSLEATVASLLIPLFLLSGIAVLSAFFFPTFVGEAVTGRAWLAIALIFFISGLGYLSLLPYADGDDDSESPVLLTIRRERLRTATTSFLAHHRPEGLILVVVVFLVYLLAQLIIPAPTTRAVSAAADTVLSVGGPVVAGIILLAVLYCLLLLLGPWGAVTLGGPEDEPAYTYPIYVTLIFTAGIAAGIVFWGPAEALFHYSAPPPAIGAAPESAGAIDGALTYSLFHWGISAWSAYAVLGVPIAYYVFVRDAPLRVSAILVPIFGAAAADTPWGRLVDTLAVFATIGGIATSIALVSEQFLAGISFQWGVTTGAIGPALFILALTLIYVLSCITGIHRGIRRIAVLTVVLFVAFGLLVVAVGPRPFLIERSAGAIGSYLAGFVPLSVYTGDGSGWVAAWTYWNWLWWFSWAPFAGVFIAAISRGRTIRTVVFTSVIATAGATMVWFLLLGGTSLHAQHTGRADILGAVNDAGGSEAIVGFQLLSSLPLGELFIFLFLGLIIVFMVTSAGVSTLVTSIIATRPGVAPSTVDIVFWGGFQGIVALSVLFVGGAETLQSIAVLTGGPFALLALVAMAAFLWTLWKSERGHTSIVRQAYDALPKIQLHHDFDNEER